VKTIRGLRQAQGWTQFELALKVGVQPQTVYLWESGRRMPQVPQLRRLGAVFGICSDEIDLETSREVGADGHAHLDAHRPRADRRPGEAAPGRDEGGRPTVRGRDDRDSTQ
jgi:transcriptional regulator with XRE-family HTH domain